jgi:hypothetical protein
VALCDRSVASDSKKSHIGLFDEVMAITGLAGSAQPGQHAGALSATMEYLNSPEVGGLSGLQLKFQGSGVS